MKLTVHLEGKTKADLHKGLKAHLALFESGEDTDAIDVSTLGKKGKKKPLKTVDADEDEDFGSEPLDEDDLDEEEDEETESSGKSRTLRAGKRKSKKVDADETEEDNDEDSEEESEGDDEADETEPSVSFQEVRAALNKYGEKHPDQARAILSTFNIKSPKELAAKQNEKYWEPVYRKVMAKIKAAKKRK
jgi:TATA-binding protein-associated factor Taf7